MQAATHCKKGIVANYRIEEVTGWRRERAP